MCMYVLGDPKRYHANPRDPSLTDLAASDLPKLREVHQLTPWVAPNRPFLVLHCRPRCSGRGSDASGLRTVFAEEEEGRQRGKKAGREAQSVSYSLMKDRMIIETS